MNESIQLTITNPSVRNLISSVTPRRGFLFVPLALACFALSSAPNAFGVTPAPDGGYPNGNTAEGDGPLSSLTTGSDNTAIGFQALFSNNGDGNTATGSFALFSNTTGGFNTATGFRALFSNTTGFDNVATGDGALGSNTTGNGNTATGDFALSSNTTGGFNTATGFQALSSNTAGGGNTASGFFVLVNNTTGRRNTATGGSALSFNTTGNANTASGFNALLNNSTGSFNTAEGFQALANSTGSNNIALGSYAGINLTTGSNNIDIGASGPAGESNTIRIGTVGVQTSAYIRGISGATVASGVTVIIDSRGHLGTVQSSARVKEAIKPMDKVSEAILALQPVTFRYKQELDPDGIPQFGLVAEEVEKVNPDLVARDADGKIYTVRYEAVNAMLLNEFLKEHSTVQELKKEVAALAATVKAQAAQIQNVSAQLESSEFATGRIRRGGPAPQIIASNE
jgi:hypothetical protein